MIACSQRAIFLQRSAVLQASRRLLQNTPLQRTSLTTKLTTTRLSRRRLLSTTQATSTSPTTNSSKPPLLVRTALVATTTAIGTPAFPVVGVLNFGLRYVVWDQATRSAILGATTILGGVITLVRFAAMDLLPVAYSYGQLFLPFAVVNGGLAGTAYLVLDAAYGTTVLASWRWTGAAIGAFVGLVGPISGLYDHAVQWFYDIPEIDQWVSYALGNSMILPISITTGGMVGLAMHPLLYYPIVGIQGTMEAGRTHLEDSIVF